MCYYDANMRRGALYEDDKNDRFLVVQPVAIAGADSFCICSELVVQWLDNQWLDNIIRS